MSPVILGEVSLTDAFLLARAQFAFTISFHIVLAAFSIGLASYLAVLEGLWLWRRKQVYLDLFNYWLKILALNFAVGIVSGVVMEYEFGTNWGELSAKAGSIIGPLMIYEVMMAFFLEAGFLGVMLFGMKRVGKRTHFFATCMVAMGSLFSAFWILSANSWMQTPAGYTLTSDGRFLPRDWAAIIFSPSFPYRLVHMTLAAYLATAFAVGAVGAWHLLRDSRNPAARVMFSMALWMAATVGPLQIIAGDQHGENTLRYQPEKIAAMEGDFDTRSGQPLILFGMPDMAKLRTDYALEIPKLGSLVLTHRWNGVVKGLKSFPPQTRPFAPVVFWAFRVMVGLGFLMAAVGLASLFPRWRGTLYESRWLMRTLVALAPAGFIAMVSGWTVTEVGRQPYTVYGLLLTARSNSPIALPGMEASVTAIVSAYVLIFGLGLFYLLHSMAIPPGPKEEGPQPHPGMTVAAPGMPQVENSLLPGGQPRDSGAP